MSSHTKESLDSCDKIGSSQSSDQESSSSRSCSQNSSLKNSFYNQSFDNKDNSHDKCSESESSEASQVINSDMSEENAEQISNSDSSKNEFGIDHSNSSKTDEISQISVKSNRTDLKSNFKTPKDSGYLPMHEVRVKTHNPFKNSSEDISVKLQKNWNSQEHQNDNLLTGPSDEEIYQAPISNRLIEGIGGENEIKSQFGENICVSLDGDMISLLDRYNQSSIKKDVPFLYSSISSSLEEIIIDFQKHPNKYSDEKINTINKLAKLVHKDDMSFISDINKYVMTEYNSRPAKIFLNEFKLDNEEYIDKYKNLPVIHYTSFDISFRNVPTDKYAQCFEILQHIFDKCKAINLISYICVKLQKDSLIQFLKLLNKINSIIFQDCREWHNLTTNKSFSTINFPNLVMITLLDCFISEEDFHRFLRILSTNKSIRENLRSIQIHMIDIYQHNFLFYCLKAKSYGFIDCKLIDIQNKDYKPYYEFEIFLSKRKIDELDIECIIKLIHIDFLKNRSMQNLWRLLHMLDYFEFEDQIDREDLYQIVSNINGFYKIHNESEFFCDCNRMFDYTTRNYSFSVFDLENNFENGKRIVDEDFPSIIVKSPFFRIREMHHCYWPFFQVGSLKLDFDDILDSLKILSDNAEYGCATEGILNCFKIAIPKVLSSSRIDLKLYYGRKQYLDNIEHFCAVYRFKDHLDSHITGMKIVLKELFC